MQAKEHALTSLKDHAGQLKHALPSLKDHADKHKHALIGLKDHAGQLEHAVRPGTNLEGGSQYDNVAHRLNPGLPVNLKCAIYAVLM